MNGMDISYNKCWTLMKIALKIDLRSSRLKSGNQTG